MSARLTDEQRRLRAITEKQWQKTVQDILDSYGWRWFHAPRAGTERAARSGGFVNIKPGWPDIAAWRGPRLLFAELKSETGKLSDPQTATLDGLRAAGAEVYVWRPSDRDEVIDVLGLAA